MDLILNRKLDNPFYIKGVSCVVVVISQHVIRIFYKEHVYDVLLAPDEWERWSFGSVDWRREFVQKLFRDGMEQSEFVKYRASINDGYLA